MAVERQYFTFESGGDRLVGNLFFPRLQPIAAIVATGPLTSVKEQAAGAYARALAERGFAALAFDHRYFGESDGQPRQFENSRQRLKTFVPRYRRCTMISAHRACRFWLSASARVEYTWQLPWYGKFVCAHLPASPRGERLIC